MNKLELNSTITTENSKDAFTYDDKEWVEKVAKFKSTNQDKRILITFEVIDTPLHNLFKYYHGEILPLIADAMGESSQVYVDKMHLKKKFLFIKINNDFNKIKSRHKTGNQFFTERRPSGDGHINDYVTGYTPSKACITHEEMKAFIKNCENFYANLFQGDEPIEWKSENRRIGMDEKTIDNYGVKTDEKIDFTLFGGE